MREIICRKYEGRDRSSVRAIAWQTAFLGLPADRFFSKKEILTDFLTLYYTDFEPESCFVAQDKTEVIGYLIGAKNTAVLERVFVKKILARLFLKSLLLGSFVNEKDLKFFWHCAISYLRGEFRGADLAVDFPATLHINIKDDFRNLGIGTKLISIYLEYLKDEKVRGVHLATMSEKAGRFFLNQGFSLLYQYRRSYFRYILARDITVYIYGQKL